MLAALENLQFVICHLSCAGLGWLVTNAVTSSKTGIAALGFSPQRLERLHRTIQSFVEEGKHAGISVLLLRRGEVADLFTVGMRDREAGLPMQGDTIVRIYSLTKIITSVAALTLIEEGKLGLLHPVEKYLPELSERVTFLGGTAQQMGLTPAESPITIHHLFTHTSGYTYGIGDEPLDEVYQRAGPAKAESLDGLVKILARIPLKREPGTAFEYGYSTDILARVVEVVSGKPFDIFIKERILDPLGMVDTGFTVDRAKCERLAKVYEHGTDGGFRVAEGFDNKTSEEVKQMPAGGAGLFSTIEDYGRFGQMLCNGGELNGVRILSRKAFEQMTVDHLAGLPVIDRTFTEGYGFGLGVAVRINNGLAGTLGTLGSFGWSGRTTTLCSVDPAEELVMLLFAQHLPFDEHGLFERFTNLVYQALD